MNVFLLIYPTALWWNFVTQPFSVHSFTSFLYFVSFQCPAFEIISSHNTISFNNMTYFLFILHTTRSMRCFFVTILSTNLDSKSAEAIYIPPHLLSPTLEVLDAVTSPFFPSLWKSMFFLTPFVGSFPLLVSTIFSPKYILNTCIISFRLQV